MAICIENNDIFTRFNEIAAQYSLLRSVQYKYRAIVYKAPGQNTSKIILASAAGNWDDGAVPLSNIARHSFAATLEHVVQANNHIKFLAYNNVPPAVPNVKTKSNSKGVIIVQTTANVDSAAWVVHTIPGFPTAKTPYTWPAAEDARGHLLICLTISESQINAIDSVIKYDFLSITAAIVYKAPGQNTGKIILASAAGNWDDGAAPLSNNRGHSFAVTLEHVVQANNDIKFLAYNNVPPAVPNVKTKSNSKGVIIVQTTANVDSAAWVVHTIPGFPTAKTPYTWPAAEDARGHLLICLTISESQINAIAASLLLVQPVIHYNEIPQTETAGMPYFKRLAEGQTPIRPPFTSRRSIRTRSPRAPVTVHIYSKSESSKYEIYKKVIVKALKKTIKVWSRRDNKLKGDCRVPERYIRVLQSSGVTNGHNTNIQADDTNWAVSDPGSKNQSKEPAIAICIENNGIFTRFNEIAAKKRSSAIKVTASIIKVGGPFHEASVSRMNILLDSIVDFLLYLNLFITCFLLFFFCRRNKARSKDDENDLNEPVTDVASENCEMEQNANVLNEELDRHVEQEQKPIQIVMLVQIEREKPKSGLYVEYTAEMKFRVNEESVQIKINPKNLQRQFALKITTYLRVSMKLLLTLKILHSGEESGKKVEPLPCKDRGSKASCNRYMKKDNFEELCKENRRIGRYLCCKTCAEKLGVEVNEDGKFKDTENVVQTHGSIKFLAYNNVPPGIPNIKTKSNSKGVIIISTAANSAAAWVVHKTPGFPTAKTPYNWPASETARGHLLICLTFSFVNTASLLLVQPVIHYNDIPETETAGMPYFKKLAEGQTPIIPPFRSRHTIRTQNAGAPVTVHIYSKSESSKYEIYKKVIVKALKKTIKVWSRRDNKLKGDCRVPERYIRLLQSPGVTNGHNTNIQADDTNWAVSDPGSIICHVDKPYFKNQSKEPAMAICIENNDIFTRFNEIAAQAVSKDVENYLSEPVTDVASENCEMEQSANVLNEELDRHVEEEQKPKQVVMLVEIEREKPKSGLYVEYTAEMKFRVNEESVQMYKPTLKKTVNVADAGINAVQSFIMKIFI
ncbi:Deoxyribonuclease-2-beta, partial [Trichinella sp. T8]